ENIIIVLLGIIFGLVFGVLISRLTAMIAFEMMGLGLLEMNMSLIVEGVRDVVLLAGLTYVIISLIPLRTISKSSIIELLNDQVKGDEFKKKPIISTIIFVIATIALLYQMFYYMPKSEFIDVKNILLYFGNAIIVAWFLFKGPISYYFINFRDKQKGIKSPIKLLSFNHLGSKVSGLARMMSFITIISATMVAILLFTFGMMNKMEDGMGSMSQDNNNYPKLKIISDKQSYLNNIEKQLKDANEPYTKLNIYSFGKTVVNFDDETEDPIRSQPAVVFKESDFEKMLKADGKKVVKIPANKKFLALEGDNFETGARESIKKVIRYSGFKPGDGEYYYPDSTLFSIDLLESLDEMKPRKKELVSKFNYPDIIVLPDNNRTFNKIQKFEVINLHNRIEKSNSFSLFNIIYNDNGISSGNVIVSSDLELNTATSFIVMGLFQVIFLMASIVITIALMMAIFFRTLENLESSVNDYIIAKQVGLKRSQITVSIFIEAFISQLLPFIIGGGVSIVMFNQMIVGKMEGLDSVLPLIQEHSTTTILSSLCGLLVILLIILMYIVLKQIYRLKAVKAD
ncbi:MAG: hypothetical protein RR601_05615, partial [Erysipelotrichales bacterium]